MARKKSLPRRAAAPIPGGKYSRVRFENGIAWVALHRPEKRNAMSPALNAEMMRVIDALEADPRCRVLVLTGSGEAFSSGMDLKEYFREVDALDFVEVMRIQRHTEEWQWRRLSHYAKPTIAMVNGWCFGGAIVPLVACDLAVAAEEAVFGISEINWGIIPAGNVSRALADTLDYRSAMYYIMTGETFTGKKAVELGLVNFAVPRAELRGAVRKLARRLMEKNPVTLSSAKIAYKYARAMDWDMSADYLHAKGDQLKIRDREAGRTQGLKQFLDEKSFRPGLGAYRRKR
jgi:trans-feruloyl-CoA hydratase/vanillin synthase